VEKLEKADKTLDSLEKKATTIETWLSLLKRRRTLALKETQFISAYRESARKASDKFPASGSLALIASESLLMRAPSDAATTDISTFAPRLYGTAFAPLSLSLYILAGALQTPEEALKIPYKESLWNYPGELDAELATDLLLLRIIAGDRAGAAAVLNTTAAPLMLSAEFFYDYDDPLRAAQLLSKSSDEKSMALQADALYRAGLTANASTVWTALSGTDSTSPDTKVRSLYNLSAAAGTPEESLAILTRLFAEVPWTPNNQYLVYATIRYTRLLNRDEALTLLKATKQDTLTALEMHRRQAESQALDKSIAETWMLLDTYPDDERMYRWAAYYYDYQERPAETAILIRWAERRGITGAWLNLHKGLSSIRESRLDDAENYLQAVPAETAFWQAPANIALIREARRSPTTAIEYYQKALDRLPDQTNAARLQLHISHCLRSLGRESESRAALEQSLKLDPDYLDARIELRRFN
jgi:tetratricopeptide (TPR) repeat protein